jgi:hypothetical protein
MTQSSCLGRLTGFCFIHCQPILVVTLATVFLAGCAGGGSAPPPLSGSTTVVLLASSTANDQLAANLATLTSLTLTSQSGKQVAVLASPVGDEFIHLNGHVEPLVTVSVPQDVYVSATIDASGSSYCLDQTPGETAQYEFPSGANSVVNLPNPITVTGTAMGLVLDLQIAPLQGGCPTSSTQYVTSPPEVMAAFSLTPMALAAQPTNSTNGMAPGLQGLISSVDAGGTGFTVNALVNVGVLNPPTWHAAVNGSTVFQTFGASQLAAGLPVDMDLAIQPDGSLLATRVEAISTETTTLTTITGAAIEVTPSIQTALIFGAAQAGYIQPEGAVGFGDENFGSATFQPSSQLGNYGGLPFTASFNAATIVPGQNLTLTTHATAFTGGPNYTPATTMTLMPQTINGTVSAVSTSGSFTTYTVTLASYDLFPQFAVQPEQATLLTNPNTVVVYADSNTQMLNSGTIAAGSAFRFYGLIYNNNGTLRMDCAQVNDGVTE